MINLDGLSVRDLEIAADNLLALHQYATLKRSAMRYRVKGEIRQANETENLCEEIYNKLDEPYKW